MGKELIFLSTSTQSVAADTQITLPIILRRRGCAIESFGAGAILRKAGYYKVNGTITFTTPTAGLAEVEVQKSGVLVPSMTSSVTTSAATDVHTLAVNGIIRVYCGENNTFITLVNSGVAINVISANLDISYYD